MLKSRTTNLQSFLVKIRLGDIGQRIGEIKPTYVRSASPGQKIAVGVGVDGSVAVMLAAATAADVELKPERSVRGELKT